MNNYTGRDYNTYISLFPNNIFTVWAGFQRNHASFAAWEASREALECNFPAQAVECVQRGAASSCERVQAKTMKSSFETLRARTFAFILIRII